MKIILASRLAKRVGVHERIAEIIRDLESFANVGAKFDPRFGILTAGDCPHLGCGHEEGARFSKVIGGQIDLGFAFPSLPRADTKGHAGPF